MIRFPWYCIALLIFTSCSNPNNTGCQDSIPPGIAKAIPSIGKWMYEKQDKPAQWLGFKLGGKTLFEPINIIIVDTLSTSVNDSRKLIIKQFSTAGFNMRPGHTSTYQGIMNNQYFPQLPDSSSNAAFSNYLWTFTNDHTRLFGPYFKDGIYIWIGAASRERGLSHDYITFKGAEKEYTEKLVKFAAVKKLGCFDLHNKQNNETDTTGDHDGFAVVLQIQ
ncbi:hypothetical protein DVR12_13975 [Chitinophaga silvatica]|uniref:LssY C-terminus n=1 Tax=Chitinophaga silvatica TaxID=2282649 RepID=A0A3E1Y8P7_9BACT|nr:hypothetical protein [Chitinophaga silvatica]RFS21764.1 hypothetical protein DVR12_13975 [Chitinophaga silvatica]